MSEIPPTPTAHATQMLVGNSDHAQEKQTLPINETSSSTSTGIQTVATDQSSSTSLHQINDDNMLIDEQAQGEISSPPDAVKAESTVSKALSSPPGAGVESGSTFIPADQKTVNTQYQGSSSFMGTNSEHVPLQQSINSQQEETDIPHLNRKIYLRQDKDQYRKVEMFIGTKMIGEMNMISQTMFTYEGPFGVHDVSLSLKMQVSKNVVNRWLTGNEVRVCTLTLMEDKAYAFAFDQNHTNALVDYGKEIVNAFQDQMEMLECLLRDFSMSKRTLDTYFVTGAMKSLPLGNYSFSHFVLCVFLGFKPSNFFLTQTDCFPIFNGIMSVPFSHVKHYRYISRNIQTILRDILPRLYDHSALDLLVSDYTTLTGYEIFSTINYLPPLTKEGYITEFFEKVQKKKQEIIESGHAVGVSLFLLRALPIRMMFLDFILQLNPNVSSAHDYKEKFKQAIGTELNMQRLYQILENYPSLRKLVETQIASLVMSERVDVEDETEILRIQQLITESQLKDDVKTKVLLATLKQLPTLDGCLQFLAGVLTQKKLQHDDLVKVVSQWLAFRLSSGYTTLHQLLEHLDLCVLHLGGKFQETIHKVILPKIYNMGSIDETLLVVCVNQLLDKTPLESISSPSSVPTTTTTLVLSQGSLYELVKIVISKLDAKKVHLYLSRIDEICNGRVFIRDLLDGTRQIIIKLLDLMDTNRLFENDSWYKMIKVSDRVGLSNAHNAKVTTVKSKISLLNESRLATNTVETLEQLHRYNGEMLKLYLGEQCLNTLNVMIDQIHIHKELISDMKKILEEYCTVCTDFEQIKKKYNALYEGMMKMTFAELQNQPTSPENKNLKTIIFCKESIAFSRLLKMKRKHVSSLLVSDIIELGSYIAEELVSFSKSLFSGQEIATFKVLEILGSIKNEKIRKEVNFLAKLVNTHGTEVEVLSENLEILLSVEHMTRLAQAIVSISKSGIVDFDTNSLGTLENFGSIDFHTSWIETCQLTREMINIYYLDNIDSKFLITLENSLPLLQFIKDTDQQSIMALVNAVEDLGDNFIREETVADLIEATKLLRPIISQKYSDIQDFCRLLTRTNVESKLVGKVETSFSSINSLKRLLNSIANRGELTKETIQNAVQKGYFEVLLNGHEYDLLLHYRSNNDQHKTVSFAEIQDLRSRALLIVNSSTRKDQTLDSIFHVTMESFVGNCDLAFEYLEKINNLKTLGFNKDYSTDELLYTTLPIYITIVKEETEAWQKTLNYFLEKYFFLNFFTPEQFWILERYFSDSLASVEEVYHLLNFVHPITEEDIIGIKFEQEEKVLDLRGRLERLGTILHKTFERRCTSNVSASYFKGTLEVLSVDSKELLKTILKIYTNTLPKPSNLLFCEHTTTWQQLRSIIFRSFYNNLSGDVYCIAQIEKLSFALQHKLVNEVNRLKELNLEKKGSLCLIDSGGNHTSYIVNQFKRYLQTIPSTVDTNRNLQPASTAFVYWSTLSGVGKTESIRLEAIRRRKRLVHLPIMDVVDRSELCARLKNLNLSDLDCLHIDIKNLTQSHACVLNNLIFEIVIFGMVIDNNVMFKIPIQNLEIFIELESHSRFLNHLTVCDSGLVKKEEILFLLENLVFNKTLLSRSQVTFNYLRAFNNNTLDTNDITFTGSNISAQVIPDEECRDLINKYFFRKMKKGVNFSLMHVFINVLSEQFIKLSQSVFLKTDRVAKLTTTLDIRSKLVEKLIDVFSEFSTRSVSENREQQYDNIMGQENTGLFKESTMIRWEESNHLIIAFHKFDSTITALYRDLNDLKESHPDIFETLQSQKVSLPDYSTLDQDTLISELGKMAGTSQETNVQYAMTADNLLKMMLILLRIEASVPVVISGETGCGKTSLVEFLAKVTGASFSLLNFHAGTNAETITNFMEVVIEKALTNPTEKHWVFLDEINTCDYLGLVSEIITLKSLRGVSLPKNISIISACNPYRKKKTVYTSALEKVKASELAYRVNPLPDCLMDYIWDYGYLSASDEKSYIQTMLGRLQINFSKDTLCKIVCDSQQFVRGLEDASSVSLRDVNRFIVLCQYFMNTLKHRPEPLKKVNHILWIQQNQSDDKYDVASIVLSLSICYYSRLAKLEFREKYISTVCGYLRNKVSEKDFVRIVDEEQTSYLRRMEIPPNIAWNRSLKENVFIILTCILNKLPVFVVGKPGCSKSLAIQLLTSNLRGEDSIDEYFKSLPQLIFIAFQGSESSTSEGILKVFEKARGYLKINDSEEKVIPVVILDEIGLAEISNHNPLKALHALLEPKTRDVAVVGISNWRLDAAKMNRAIHVSRPEADENELKEIAKTILYENNHVEKTESIELYLDYLSKSYHEFILRNTLISMVSEIIIPL